ncbi:hypothetical protein [Kitasatospora sp. NPDC050463]|uniref:hypothetical protein n=1 Tax=Kitasatospora sp. NPDC050463 TaxID=3155786 RepID=UPI0033E799D7
MSKHRSTRTTNSTARRALAGCTIAGAALFATVSGGQAWADGVRTPSPTAPAVDNPDQPGPVATPTARPSQAAPAVATSTARPGDPKAPQAAPAVATPTAAPSRGPVVATPTATPSSGPVVRPADGAQPSQGPQVTTVPQGAAQAGDGSGTLDDAGTRLIGGSAAAAVGAGALGFALLRRRSGARG